MAETYILTIDPNSQYDLDELKKRLDKCVDWTRLYACNYLLYTTSDDQELYSRFKRALPDNKFFIARINLNENKYTGWLKNRTWDRLKEFKKKTHH